MHLVKRSLDLLTHLVLRPRQCATVGVMNDGQFLEIKHLVHDGDVSEGLADIASSIADDEDF